MDRLHLQYLSISLRGEARNAHYSDYVQFGICECEMAMEGSLPVFDSSNGYKT